MTTLFLKNIRWKCVTFFGVMLVVYYTLIKLEGLDAVLAFRSTFGGNQLYRPIVIISFMIYVALIQYLHIDSIMVFLKNDIYLSVRYGNEKPMFKSLLTNMFFINMICVILTVCSWCTMLMMCSYDMRFVDWGQVADITIRGYITCTIVIIVQSILLLQWNETNTFMAMILFCVFFVLLSYTDFEIVSICPFLLDKGLLSVNIGLCVVYILVGLFFYRKKYKEREIGKYGN